MIRFTIYAATLMVRAILGLLLALSALAAETLVLVLALDLAHVLLWHGEPMVRAISLDQLAGYVAAAVALKFAAPVLERVAELVNNHAPAE